MPNPIRGAARERFLRGRRVGVLATIGADGAPVVTPIWFIYRDGRFLMRTAEDSAKAQNVRRDPRASICVQDERAPYASVTAYGDASIEEPEAALESEMPRRYLGMVGAMAYKQTREAIEAGAEVTLVLTPRRWATQDFGAETPWYGKLWLVAKRVLPPWL